MWTRGWRRRRPPCAPPLLASSLVVGPAAPALFVLPLARTKKRWLVRERQQPRRRPADCFIPTFGTTDVPPLRELISITISALGYWTASLPEGGCKEGVRRLFPFTCPPLCVHCFCVQRPWGNDGLHYKHRDATQLAPIHSKIQRPSPSTGAAIVCRPMADGVCADVLAAEPSGAAVPLILCRWCSRGRHI